MPWFFICLGVFSYGAFESSDKNGEWRAFRAQLPAFVSFERSKSHTSHAKGQLELNETLLVHTPHPSLRFSSRVRVQYESLAYYSARVRGKDGMMTKTARDM